MKKDLSHDRFEQALRAGPPPAQPSLGFTERVENAWRRADPQTESERSRLRWKDLRNLIFGPSVALATLALFLLALQLPRESPVPAGASMASHEEVAPDPGPVSSGAVPTQETPAILARLQAGLEEPYAEEAELLLADARRALQFAAKQVLSPEWQEAAAARGLPIES